MQRRHSRQRRWWAGKLRFSLETKGVQVDVLWARQLGGGRDGALQGTRVHCSSGQFDPVGTGVSLGE